MKRKPKAAPRAAEKTRRPPAERRVVFHTGFLRGTLANGGASTDWTVQHANGLAKLGYEVHVGVRADESSMTDAARSEIRGRLADPVKVSFLGESRRVATFKLGILIRRVGARTLVATGHTYVERGIRLRRLFGPGLNLVGVLRVTSRAELDGLPDEEQDRYRAAIARYQHVDVVICGAQVVADDLVRNFGLKAVQVRVVDADAPNASEALAEAIGTAAPVPA